MEVGGGGSLWIKAAVLGFIDMAQERGFQPWAVHHSISSINAWFGYIIQFPIVLLGTV